MSVLIKDMEMPTGCGELTLKIWPSGRVEIINEAGEWKTSEVVPVPLHGRLGDLDKLIEKIDGIWDCNDMVFSPNDHCCNVPEDCKGCKWAETKNFIRRMIANAQTIIPAEGVTQKDGGQNDKMV